MNRLNGFVIVFFLLPALLLAGQQGQSRDSRQDRIVEKVDVTNVAVAVRVFHKGKPVKGLKKEDFTLFENGKEKDIRVFFQRAQKISPVEDTAGAGEGEKSRLFLLTFNVGDHRIDIKRAVAPFFDKFLRKGDRIMVLSNSFFLNDRVVFDPGLERQKVEHILEIEKIKAHWRYTQMEEAVRVYAGEMQDLLEATAGEAWESARDIFITGLLSLVRATKESFMRLDNEQFVRLAKYLKEQDIEKWVFNFYQLNHFLSVKPGSGFDGFLSGSQKYFELMDELKIPTEVGTEHLSQLFINSGAAFHTILMGTENKKFKLSGGFDYAPLALDTESILRNVTRSTGGTLVKSNKADKFFKKVTGSEDVYYTLVYVPDETNEIKRPKVKVVVNNKKYKVVYDNQKRKDAFQKLLAKAETKIPQITLGNLFVENGILNFPVSNFKLNKTEAGGKVRVRISIFDPNEAKFVFDRKKEIDAKQETLDVRIALNELESGHYRVFVEVTDLLTEKNDLGLTEMDFSAKNRI